MFYDFEKEQVTEEAQLTAEQKIDKIMIAVINALKSKNYDAGAQLMGYLVSNDPSYITTHMNARSEIQKVDREEIIEHLVEEYIKSKGL